MASVRVTPRVRPQARQSAVRFRQPGPSAIVRPPSPEPQSSRRASVGDKPGVLPALEHPENFKDSSKCDVWVVAEKILTPGVDTSPIAAQCHQCSRTLDLRRKTLPGGWLYSCPDCAQAVTSPRTWVDSMWTAILNLQQAFNEKSFHHREEIAAYLNSHWHLVCGTRERTATWWKTVLTTLTAHPYLFRCYSVTDRIGSGSGSSKWAIVEDAAEAALAASPRTRGVSPAKSHGSPRAAPMRAIPLDDEDEIEFQLPVPKRSHKRGASGNPRPLLAAAARPPPGAASTRTVIQRAHQRLADERKSKSRTGLTTDRGCHHCRIVRAGLWRCSSFVQGTSNCVRKFCTKCIEKYEQLPADDVDSWTCLVCRSVCKCARCEHDAVVGTHPPVLRRAAEKKRSHHKDKREHKKRRTADYDIAKVVYHGVPLENVRIAPVATKEIDIPTWRPSERVQAAAAAASAAAASPAGTPSRSHKKRAGGASPRKPAAAPASAAPEESDDEDTDDAAFEERHRRAADQLRNETKQTRV